MSGRKLIALCVAGALLLGAAATAGPVAVPCDAQGLPLWQPRVWTDFPVRIELSSPAALAELLHRVPIASFDRELVRPLPGGGIVLEPRVTEAELSALTAAGYAISRLPDREREGREAMEAAWAAQAAKGAEALRTGEKGAYHTADQIGQLLEQIAAAHPDLARYYTLGTSVQGRPLHAIEISGSVGTARAEPEVRLASTIHGNEPVQLENLLSLADTLTSGHGRDPAITALVDSTDIHIVPCLNPDGLAAGRRENAHGVDLNRNFPVPNGAIGDDGTFAQEPETIAIRQHGAAHHFVVSENGHTGSLVVNYPWDYTFALAPDDSALVLLSLEYSSRDPPMYASPVFPRGITNGARWYVVMGSLQDWSYSQTGCVDLTIEVDDTFIPPAEEVGQLWDENRASLLALLAASHYGVHGRVTAARTGAPLAATVTVTGNARPVATDPAFGDYYKLLPTGTYELVFAAAGYEPRTIDGVVTTWGTPTALDVALEPAAQAAAARLTCGPNPFGTTASLRFGTAVPGRVRLAVYDLRGRLVRRLLDAELTAGDHPVPWDGTGGDGAPLPDGVYVARLRTAAGTQNVKLTLAR